MDGERTVSVVVDGLRVNVRVPAGAKAVDVDVTGAGEAPATEPIRAAGAPIADDFEAFRRHADVNLGLSATTLRKKMFTLRRWQREIGWQTRADVAPESFWTWMSEQGDLAQQTRANLIATAKGFYDFLMATGRVQADRNPFAHRSPHKGRSIRQRGQGVRPLTVDETRVLIERALQLMPYAKGVAANRPLWYAFAFVSGIRRNEIRQLRAGDLHLSGVPQAPAVPLVIVPNERDSAKCGHGGPVALSDELAARLERYVADEGLAPDDRLFARTPGYDRLYADLEAAGIAKPSERGIGFHSFRKGVLNHLAFAGDRPALKLAQGHARHASEAMTERHYLSQWEDAKASYRVLRGLRLFPDSEAKAVAI